MRTYGLTLINLSTVVLVLSVDPLQRCHIEIPFFTKIFQCIERRSNGEFSICMAPFLKGVSDPLRKLTERACEGTLDDQIKRRLNECQRSPKLWPKFNECIAIAQHEKSHNNGR